MSKSKTRVSFLNCEQNPIRIRICHYKKMGNILFSIIWLIILIFIGFWIAGIAAGIYILVLPFTVCIDALSGLTDFLLSVVQFPKYCAQGIMEGKGFN
ncbi:uncharacterized protein LOC110992220 [Pieris rapae]|uniref:uncharacterized protein LOC110992220 n=1 Tax=Pieris rapae TaxID=64459 RepID=UPI001E27BF68|nr:uncharacterized protein LOC110992220 [Pieris rapae]